MKRYQPYAWNGKRYVPISLPIYDTMSDAIRAAMKMISEPARYHIIGGVRQHYKEKSILANIKDVDLSIYKFRKVV